MRERRRARRYQVTLPVELDKGTGRTIDMSSTGIFFESATDALDEPPSEDGKTIRFAVCVEDGPDEIPMRLNCLGRVTRIEPRDGHIGIGATIDKAFISRKHTNEGDSK